MQRAAPALTFRLPISIEHRRLWLDNGLEVIVHPHHRLPRVVVNLLFRVGSGDDPRRRRGLAHLFEHLMFMGTRRLPEQAFDLLMERAGGWNNAFTSEDQTVYYDVGPARLLEQLLWAEADRMANLAGAIDEEKLALQRDVVLNELWQNYTNAPYGALELALPALLYPRGHPYSWPVIGAEADLRRVTLTDVRRHFSRYYAPGNAALVIAGDVDPDRAARLARRYFGWIPPAQVGRRRPPRRPGGLDAPVRRVFEDRVEQPKLVIAWHSPANLTPGDAELDLAADLLASGKQARLHRNLVHRQRLATHVAAYQWSRRLGSLFVVEVTARQGAPRREVERRTLEIVAALFDRRPGRAELARAKNGYETHFVARLQQVQRRAELLNLYAASAGQPDHAAADLARYHLATAESVQRWCRAVLRTRRRGTFWVVPGAGTGDVGEDRP